MVPRDDFRVKKTGGKFVIILTYFFLLRRTVLYETHSRRGGGATPIRALLLDQLGRDLLKMLHAPVAPVAL